MFVLLVPHPFELRMKGDAKGARTTCIDSGSFDFQREIPILFAAVCRVHTHGTNVIQNECAY